MHDLALDGLAVYRLTRLVTRDKIGEPLRHAVIRSAYRRAGYLNEAVDPEVAVEVDPDPPKLAYLVTCPWCLGLWATAAAGLVRWVAGPDAWRALRRPLAVAAVAGLVQTLEDR